MNLSVIICQLFDIPDHSTGTFPEIALQQTYLYIFRMCKICTAKRPDNEVFWTTNKRSDYSECR